MIGFMWKYKVFLQRLAYYIPRYRLHSFPPSTVLAIYLYKQIFSSRETKVKEYASALGSDSYVIICGANFDTSSCFIT